MENDELLEELINDAEEVLEGIDDMAEHVRTAVTVETIEDLQANLTTALAGVEVVTTRINALLGRCAKGS